MTRLMSIFRCATTGVRIFEKKIDSRLIFSNAIKRFNVTSASATSSVKSVDMATPTRADTSTLSPSVESPGTTRLVAKQKHYMEVEYKGETVNLNYMWLRENCQCPLCYDPKVNGKYVDTLAIPLDIQPADITVTDSSLELTWPDDHKTSYQMDWLMSSSQPKIAFEKQTTGDRQLWDSSTFKDCNVAYEPYEQYMNDPKSLKSLLSSLLKYGVAFVTGVPPDIDHSQEVAERICMVDESVYGKMYYIKTDPEVDHVGLAYTKAGLGAHTDTPYYSVPNGLQQFHLLYHDGEGGDTLLVDGFNCAEKLWARDPDSYDFLTNTKIPFLYKESTSIVGNLANILRTHPITGDLVNIRYNKEDRSPVNSIPHEDLHKYYRAWNGLTEQIKSPDNEHWFKLNPGTVMFTDNWRVLHGRSGFTGYRSLCGCYLNRDEFLSKARVMGLLDSTM